VKLQRQDQQLAAAARAAPPEPIVMPAAALSLERRAGGGGGTMQAMSGGTSESRAAAAAFRGSSSFERLLSEARAVVAGANVGAGAAAAAAPGESAQVVSCDAMMKQLEQVWPVELTAPALRNVELRPYQRQSLAFMLELERAPEGAETVGTVHIDIEKPDHQHETFPVRGGWLTDEVGMGKTMVCIALILSNPFAGQSTHKNKIAVKTTVILTKNSLLGQWKDELQRFAPHLDVVFYHSATNKTQRDQIDRGEINLSQVDIILGTHETAVAELRKKVKFHRIICDEAHELRRGQLKKMPESDLRWAVTGTPMTTAFADLDVQSRFVGHGLVNRLRLKKCNCVRRYKLPLQHRCYHEDWIRNTKSSLQLDQAIQLMERRQVGLQPPASQAQAHFANLLQKLRLVMIRHSKSQRIAGDVALALPELDSETVFLQMSPAERELYEDSRRRDMLKSSFSAARENGTTLWHLEMVLSNQRHVCSESDSKLTALVNDLRSLRLQNPHLHAVVFTQSKYAHTAICARLQACDFTVYKFAGKTKVTDRHDYIRQFQAAEAAAKVFVMTMRTGNCGITLTAATRVYMLEPCVSPAHELQAAGRIHRLGQSQGVLVKRFCYMHTYEQNLVQLHAQLKSGATSLTDGRKFSAAAFQDLTRT
jgi:SNF2 family DNA or RNA helicase